MLTHVGMLVAAAVSNGSCRERGSAMSRWTIQVGDDEIVIEHDPGELVHIEIPSGRPLKADRAAVEAIRLRLGAALGTVDQ